jgi:hypothetical protein
MLELIEAVSEGWFVQSMPTLGSENTEEGK